MNNERVYEGAKEAGMTITNVFPIKGTTRKKQNLFAVYVMCIDDTNSDAKTMDIDLPNEMPCEVSDTISVRNENGKWTTEYTKIMAAMSIPCNQNESHS